MGIKINFDVVGSKEKAVAIVEIQEGKTGKEIAEEIIRTHKNIKSVLKKTSGRKGEYRIREYEFLAGDENTEVTHKEYGCSFRLDPQKVYFSPREATERQRIAEQVKAGERVLVMFGGVAPFAIIIAKRQPLVEKIYSIEINKTAHDYAVENIRINRMGDRVVVMKGDVHESCPKYYGTFDRVVMPLPLGAESFLDVAMKSVKTKGVIHFYNWGKESDLYAQALRLIEDCAEKLNKKIKTLNKRKVLVYAPRKWKICIDFEVQG